MYSKIVSGIVLLGLVLISSAEYNHGLSAYNTQGYYGGNQLQYSSYGSQGQHHYPSKGSRVETYLKQEFQVPIPQPYPVHIVKNIPVPYPVKVPVHVENPVPVPVIKPYPVHVEKKVPYPVVKNIPYPVKVPYNVPYPVEVKVPVEKPYPVHVTKNVPYIVKQPVYIEKKVPVYVHEPHQHQESGYGQLASINYGYGHGY